MVTVCTQSIVFTVCGIVIHFTVVYCLQYNACVNADSNTSCHSNVCGVDIVIVVDTYNTCSYGQP